MYDNSKIEKWWYEEFWFPIYNENTTLDRTIIRKTYPEYMIRKDICPDIRIDSYIEAD